MWISQQDKWSQIVIFLIPLVMFLFIYLVIYSLVVLYYFSLFSQDSMVNDDVLK